MLITIRLHRACAVGPINHQLDCIADNRTSERREGAQIV